MAALVPTIETKGFQNWLRGALAVLFAKQGLECFVIDELTQFQSDILTSIFKNNNIPAGTVCTTCTTENVLYCPTQNFCPKGRHCNIHYPTVPDKTPKPCPNGICQDVKDCIRRKHRYNGPSWKNTNAKGWCTDVIEIAKCYMPPDGYSHVTSIGDTDFNGTLAVILNHKRFESKLTDPLGRPDNVCNEAREVCRLIRHSADFTISDTDLSKYIDTLIRLLSDPIYLAAERNAKEAVEKLDQLKSNTLTVITADIITVLDNALKDIIEKRRDNVLQDISEERRKALDELEEKKTQVFGSVKTSLTNMQTVTTSSLDKIIEAKQSALNEIRTIVEKEKREFTAISSRGKETIEEVVGREKDEFQNVAEREKQDFKTLSESEKQVIKDETGKQLDEIKTVAEKEKHDFKSLSERERQNIKDETGKEIENLKNVAEKEKQDFKTLSERKTQVIKDETGKEIDEFKNVAEKEKYDFKSLSERGKQSIKDETEKEIGEFKNEAEKERQDFKLLSEREKTGIKDETEKEIDKFKNVAEKEEHDIKSLCEREKQSIKDETGKEKDELKDVAEKGIQVFKSLSEIEKRNIKDETGKEIDKIKCAAEKEKQELTAISKREQKLIKDESRKDTASCTSQPLVSEINITTERRKELEKSLREDLITYYRQYYNTIPIAPLVEEHDVELVDFYVQPPLTAIDLEKTFGQFPTIPARTPVHSYQDLFLGTDGNPYKNIYITAKAGIGKTSFVKKICLTWCQAHGPLETRKLKFMPGDVDVLKQFDFLFVISLRETNTSTCEIDAMIYSQIIESLSGAHRYSEYILKEILQNSTCLIVLDGLDEWSHPTNCRRGCPNVHEIHIPHRPARERCSVLSTTRPWKLDVAKLRTNQIDRHVEINELDQSSSEQLIWNALTILNKQSVQNNSKTIEEFKEAIDSLKIDTIRYIPYILLQMICLWFDGKSVGKSKCEIYSNVIDLTFARGIMRCGEQVSSSEGRERLVNYPDIPICLRFKECCKLFYNVLLPLGKIAFHTLFGLKEESSLVFDKTILDRFLSDAILGLCLEMGFLSQNKAYGCVSTRQSTFSFQHKSIQEYFAALYIQSESDNEDVQHTVYNKCKTLATVLEISNVFIFLGGLKPEVCEKILQSLQDAISSDQITRSYRNVELYFSFFSKNNDYLNTMRDLQSMQTDIINEILNNDLKYVPSFIEDILLDSTIDKNTYPVLRLLIEKNKSNIKSMCIRDCQATDEFTGKLYSLELRNVQSLHKLEISAVPRQQDLHRLLSESAHTLICLGLHFVVLKKHEYCPVYTNISTKTIRTILSMHRLRSISLGVVCLVHLDIDALLSFITKKTTMTEISLHAIKCTDHKGECTGICLDLSKHQKLETLHIDYTIITNLQVNTSSLKTCYIRDLPVDVYPSLLNDLQHATVLREYAFGGTLSEVMLENIIETLPKHENLKLLVILNSNLRNESLTVPTEMKSIDKVWFYMVTMTSAALRKLLESIDLLPQSVCIELLACTVKPQEKYKLIKAKIKASPKYKVTFDGLNKSDEYCFVFHSVGQNL